MWVILPVKAFKNAKLRLANVLTPAQRARFSYLMLEDILQTLSTSEAVQGITLISSDQSVQTLAKRYQTEFQLTDLDSGYSHDAMQAITTISQDNIDTLAIIPADVPQLSHEDLSRLHRIHDKGMTLCPAIIDGGTNGLLFSPPLPVPLMFGIDSLSKYQSAAAQNDIQVRIEKVRGLERDIDRPEDLLWLKEQKSGGKAWSYILEM
jgi:2-phospho-L-lactate/phosphoenolpyruvate guanylyltransferase